MNATESAVADIHDVARTAWDAIVIGAGPAGALAARHAALWGLKTLLVDAKAFPREKVCGGYLNGRALEVLQRTGLEPLAIDCPQAPVSELELFLGRKKTRLPLPPGCVICRTQFDAHLVESATYAGATFLASTPATVEPTVRDSTRCVTVVRNGRRETLTARVVICADGLSRSSVRHVPEFAASTTPDSRVGIGAVVQGDTESCPLGQITMIVSRHGYVGMSRSCRDQLNVAAAVDAGLLSRASPAQIVTSMLNRAGVTLPSGLDAACWRGTPPLTSHPLHVAAERIFLVGDAGGYVEPFTGEGMAAALETAVAVTPLVAQAANRWVPSLVICWDALHRQIVRDRQATCRQLAWVLRRPWAAFAALSLCRVLPSVARHLMSKTSAPSNTCLAPGIGTL
jgi:flavin-dependent dehydrogenase